jgi:cytochrome c oxidase cbb3-type subunit 1
MHPFYVARVFAGVLYLAGGLVMVFNIAMTMKGRERNEQPIATVSAQPA